MQSLQNTIYDLREKRHKKASKALVLVQKQLVTPETKVINLEKVLAIKEKEVRKMKIMNKKLKSKITEVDDFLFEALSDVKREIALERFETFSLNFLLKHQLSTINT